MTLYQGDALTVLRTLPDASVHCCVTSPPYWGLRDYGTATWEGGDAACDHKMPKSRKGGESEKQNSNRGSWGTREWTICCKCGARRIDAQLGLEPTPELYVEHLVAVFREVKRVLRDDGTLWLNLGDSYASIGRSGRKESPGVGAKQEMGKVARDLVWHAGDGSKFQWTLPGGQKPKDLVGIPWRVAFALQADGWWLRQDIIWAKPNPMPESVRDRCTKAHEYVFLLTKSARYYYDAEAAAEPVADSTLERLGQATLETQVGSFRIPGKTNGPMKAVPPRFGGNKYGDNPSEEYRTKSGNEYALTTGKRNRRSVWTVATQPYSGAHFATMPSKLVEPCVLAGCPAGGTVLDPFAGSGTTGAVAKEWGREFIGIELNAAYIALAEERIDAVQPRLVL